MSKTLHADVLIVGAGPVGLTIAMDLAGRGHRVIVAELRAYKEPPSVKCNHVSARSMEQFRRLGVAHKLRAAGLPDAHPNDVVFRTRMTGIELARIPIPNRVQRFSEKSGPDGWWPTPEPPHRINQIFLEPILLEHVAALDGVSLLNKTRITAFTQDEDGVSAIATDENTGAQTEIRARFMIGCDGGSSWVRKQIGAKLEGTPVIQRVQSTYLKAPGLKEQLPGELAWCYYSVNAERCGTVFAIDGEEKWLVHNHLKTEEEDFDAVDRDASIRAILGVGPDFDYEIISKEDWVGRRLVADRFRDRRVFIAGDAAHLWVPYAGYGMNAGLADGLNLAFALSATLHGWGGAFMLDMYDMERRPITEQVSNFAMNHAAKMIKARGAVPACIEAEGPEADHERARVGQEAYELNVQQFCCAGLNFGYYYAQSPVIVFDDEVAPPYTMGDFTPSTVPGCRVPHFWMNDGSSLYDKLGPVYTLLVVQGKADTLPLVEAAKAAGMPLTVLDISNQVNLPPEYRHSMLVCRSDQHVAWRGNSLPPDSVTLVERLRGAQQL